MEKKIGTKKQRDQTLQKNKGRWGRQQKPVSLRTSKYENEEQEKA